MDEKSRLSFGIQLAPALVACSAYLAVNQNHIDFFAKMLLGYGLLQLVFMIRLILVYTTGIYPVILELFIRSVGTGKILSEYQYVFR